jgi:selT/selW/selH-like putative selenoprotein
LAEKLLQEFHNKLSGVNIAVGPRSSFEVSIDGKLAFSKLKEHRLPETKEIREKVRAALSRPP